MDRPNNPPSTSPAFDAPDWDGPSLEGTAGELREKIQQLLAENQRLRENEEPYRAFFQQATAGFSHTDLEGRFLNVNQKLCDMLGYAPEELLSKRWVDITPAGHRQENLQARDRMLGGEFSSYVADKQYIRKDGQLIWVHLTVSLVLTREGRPKYFLAISEDITARKREQELLHKSEQHLRSILDYTTAFIYIKDASGRYELVNPLFERLFEKTSDQIIGKTDFDLFPEELALRFRTNDLRVLELKKPLELEEVALLRDGLHTYISVKVPILDSQGRPVAVCGISTDITQRKHVEAQMFRAKEAAERANQAKSQFLANVSHEIRTPIMALLAAAEVTRGGQLSDRQVAEHSEIVLRNGRHLLSLVDDLIDQSQMDSGRLEVTRELCSLSELMADVWAITVPLRKNPVSLQFRYETDVPQYITTDRKRFSQAVINLVHNATKFTQHGHIHVRVSAEIVENSPFLSVAVEDTGEGIAQADLSRIFEPFTQLKHGARQPSGGVGLGLALARSIAVRLGGSLNVHSELGKGSTFVLRVPVTPLDGSPWVSREVASGWCLLGEEVASPAISLRGNVLLAEDAEDVRWLMAEALERAGAKVVSVPDGDRAIKAMQSESFDLVLLDIRMPGIDGMEAARKIRSMGFTGPLIALTASTAQSEYQQTLAAGFDDLWPKPLSLQKLLTLCSAYMQGGLDIPPRNPDTAKRIEQVRDEYARKLGGVMESLREATAAADMVKAREILHTMAGSSGIMGLTELAAQAGVVYQAAKAGQLRPHSPELLRLEELAKRLTV